MTWYAQQIFAEPRDSVIAAFRKLPRLADAMYHVPHLRDYETHEQVVGAVVFEGEEAVEVPRTVRQGPKLPLNGLLVIRELCNSHNDPCLEWFGEDAVRWDDVGNDLPHINDPLFQFSTLFADAPAWWERIAPPVNCFRQLHAIAQATESVVAYYACHMWGGDVECMFGWVWDGQRGTGHFYHAVNWYLTPYNRMKFNYILSQLDGVPSGTSYCSIFGLRFDMDF